MSQGQIGYLLQQELHREMAAAGSPRDVVTLITRVVVDAQDPSFQNPTKPIGSSTAEVAARCIKEKMKPGSKIQAGGGGRWFLRRNPKGCWRKR